jgi:hypothetical protein
MKCGKKMAAVPSTWIWNPKGHYRIRTSFLDFFFVVGKDDFQKATKLRGTYPPTVGFSLLLLESMDG